MSKYRWYLLPPLVIWNVIIGYSVLAWVGVAIALVGWVCALIFTVGVNP